MRRNPISKNRSIGKVTLVLFMLGIAGFFLLPFVIDNFIVKEEEHLATYLNIRPIQVRTPDGQAIGWLQITYPETLRENEEQQLDVKYVGEREAWARAKDISRMSVSLQAANLGIFPEPFAYDFNLARVVQTGEDSHVWTVSPKREGDYRLLVKFDLEPMTFTALPVAVNGVQMTSASGETALPIRVNTRYNVPQSWIDVLKAIGYILSFILTLPLLKSLVERYLDRKRPGAPST